MDETVKDEEPTAEEPEPQFSINDLDIKVSPIELTFSSEFL